MVTRTAPTLYATTLQDAEAPNTPPTALHQGRCYQLLTRGKERVSNCCNTTKHLGSILYGPPYPPMSQIEVITKYLIGASALGFAGAFGSFSLFVIITAATNPSPQSDISPEAGIGLFSIVEVASVGIAATGLGLIHKTWHAPRLEEREALIPSS